jgi:glucokinase-like ROK family protein
VHLVDQPVAGDPDLVTVLHLVRSGRAVTRPELVRTSGLGRTVVTQRVADLIGYGLLTEGDLGPSTGGRAPRQLQFRCDAGRILVAELGARGLSVGLTDLRGCLLTQREEPSDIADGPEVILPRIEEMFDALLTECSPGAPVWGIGVGVPGPVEFATGRPTAPPIMPGWDGYPIRDRLSARYRVPVWVDNEVNLMALGELRGGLAQGAREVVYLKVGTGIGAGLVSDGVLHRGAQGCAGDVGHVAVAEDSAVVCRCGNVGCLEALAGGAALGRDGTTAAVSGRSVFLADVLAARGCVTGRDVSLGASHGDPVCVELLVHSGRLIGEMLATLVNFYNPSLVLLGGGVTSSGDLFLATIRQTVYRRSLPLATRDLRLALSPLHEEAGLLGAGHMVLDELFSAQRLAAWLGARSPVGVPELVSLPSGR